MPVQYKDYYKILGVSKNATDDEIRKAFRKLAREYHPDVAHNKAGAEDKFKEVNEAYEVLSDPDKRKKYDEFGSGWQSGSEFRPPPGWQGFGTGRGANRAQGRGYDEFQFGGTGFSDFFEQLFGSMNGGRFRTGGEPGAGERGADVEGDIMVSLEEAINGGIRSISLRRGTVCQTCFGAGNVNGKTCPVCGGTGQQEKTDTYKVKIPKGVKEGQKLRIAGQGEPGADGGAAGDLYLRVRYAKHPDFRFEDGVIYYDLRVAPWEAVLGANISVPTLDGRVNIKVPAGTQNDQKLRLRERGFTDREGKKGDLIVVVKVEVPKQISESEQKLWEELGKFSGFRPRE